MHLETKSIPLETVVISCKAEAGQPTRVSGWASVFNLVDVHRDIVAPGAFTESLALWKEERRLPPMLLEHKGPPIGRWTAMREAGKGLWVEGELTPGMRLAEDVAASLRHGAIDGLSIGYRAYKDQTAARTGIRTLSRLHLREISIVGDPANVEARVAAVKGAMAAEVIAMEGLVRTMRGLRLA